MAFPSTYSVGITSLGYQVIWATLSQRKDVDVRRLFTDQSERSHKESDLFGISVSWELDSPKILELIEKEGIALWSKDRRNNDPIVFGGGPVLTANPEPLAPFFDIILLGDGEILIPNLIEAVKQIKSLGREQKLETLAQVPGIYVPSLYQPIYDKVGRLIAIEPKLSNIPKTITKQTWTGENLSHSTVISPQAAWPNIHMVEVVRSCPELCRFCLASYLNLPFRKATLEENLIPAVEKGLAVTRRIGLLGASVTQHPEFSDLLKWLETDHFNDIHLSISSVRASTVSLDMTKLLNKRGCKSITIAIESGSKKIREMINKKLSEEEIFAAAKYVAEGGLKKLKLYGMIGLPTEEIDDIKATTDLLLMLKNKTPGLRLTLGLSTFVPKAHTPFQWQRVDKNAKKRIKEISKILQSQGIEVRPESYNWSVIQALISRSDRRLAPVIALVRQSDNTLGNWKKAYKSIQEKNNFINCEKLPDWEEVIFETWSTSRLLPWEHLEGPLKKTTLIKHQLVALNQNV